MSRFSKLFRPISYIFAIVIITASLFITIVYGHTFGYVKSILWLTAFICSIVSAIFIMEPIKLFGKSIIVALFFTKPDTIATKQITDDNCNQSSTDKYFAYKNLINEHKRNFTHEDCTEKTYFTKEELRDKERLILKYRDLSQDLFLVSMYLIILLLIVLGSKDRFAYYSTKMVKDHFVDGKYFENSWTISDVFNENDFFNYVKECLLPTLHYSSSYRMFFIFQFCLYFFE